MSAGTRPFRPGAFLVATWAVNVCINGFYISPAPVFPAMIDELGITKALAGSLISFYLVSILLFQLPSGFLMDRTDPRELIVLSSIALFGLSVGMTLVPVYEVLLVLRVLAGIPVAFIFAPSAFLVSRAFARTPGRAVGLFLSAPPAGVALGNLVAPWVALAFGWPAVFVVFTVPLLAVLPFFRRAAASLPPRAHEPFGVADFLAAFRDRALWKVGAAFAASYSAYIFYASWTPTYLTESAFLDVAWIAALSSAIPAAGIVARPVGGILAETRFLRDKRWVPALGFVGLFGVSAAVPFLGLARNRAPPRRGGIPRAVPLQRVLPVLRAGPPAEVRRHGVRVHEHGEPRRRRDLPGPRGTPRRRHGVLRRGVRHDRGGFPPWARDRGLRPRAMSRVTARAGPSTRRP